MSVTVLALEPTGTIREDVSLAEAQGLCRDPAARVWVDLLDPAPEDLEEIRSLFGFHPLAVEDALTRVQRPKVDEYEGHVFLVFHGINMNEGADPLDMLELDAFLGPNYLVTVRYGRLFSIRDVMDRVRKNPKLLGRGTDYVYYAVVDRMVDYYFDLMTRFDDQVESIEQRLFERLDQDLLQGILDLKRRVLALRRVAGPQREMLNTIARGDYDVVQESTRHYFRDVHDHMLRIADSLDTYRDLLGGAMDTYITQLSNRTNETMKVLSIIATIMLPLSFLTGYFGMNFEFMPGLGERGAVWWLTGGMALLAFGMLAYFRRRKWL